LQSVIILLSMFDQGCRFARGTGAGGKSRVSKSIGFQTVEETTQSYSNMYGKNNLNKMRFSILIALKIRLQMGMPALRFPPFLSQNRCTGKLEETGRGLQQQADPASEVKAVECSAGGGQHLDGNGSAQAETGACKQWSAAEWLDGGKVVEARRQLDDATIFNGERQRWFELAIDGDDGTEERQGLGCTMWRGGCGGTGREREGFDFTEEDGGGAARLRDGS
jgi:hypothetical protein